MITANKTMAVQLPKLRSDLIFSRQPGNGEVSFVVKDPANGQFFRFKEPEHFIARQFDGSTCSEEVCRRVEENFGVEVDPRTVENFVKTLEQYGLLEATEAATTTTPARRRGRIQGNLLYLRFKACDPNRLFDLLVGKVRFCFTPYFVGFSAA